MQLLGLVILVVWSRFYLVAEGWAVGLAITKAMSIKDDVDICLSK